MSDVLPEPGHLRSSIEPVLALRTAEPDREKIERLLADYARSLADTERALTIALVGATGSGKSTLLNVLAGGTLAVEGIDRPTSREAVVYAPEDADVSGLVRARVQVARYRALADGSWSGQVFVDTPDLNSIAHEHRELARGVLEQADVAVLVLHRGSVAEAAQAHFLAEFSRRRRLVLVLNFADELGSAARETLRAQARELLAAQWELPVDALPCFAISAKEARRGVDVTGELAGLRAWLQTLADSTVATGVRRTNAGAARESLRRVLEPLLDEAELAQGEIDVALRSGMADAREGLVADLAGRLGAAQVHLRDEARRQAAGQGWGPLAAVLRLTGAGAGGLAAGTLLLRQSVPVGLAVAGATAAVGQLARRSRAKAAEAWVTEDAAGDDGTCARAARQILSGARTVALARGLSPSVWGLDDAEGLTRALVAAREEAWRFTVGSALHTAVIRWWGWARILLFPLLNAAAFALALHVAYRVGRAYAEGAYLDLRYYANAAALAGVWAIAGTALAAGTLRGAVRRARLRGTAQFAARLMELERGLLQTSAAAREPLLRVRQLLQDKG